MAVTRDDSALKAAGPARTPAGLAQGREWEGTLWGKWEHLAIQALCWTSEVPATARQGKGSHTRLREGQRVHRALGGRGGGGQLDCVSGPCLSLHGATPMMHSTRHPSSSGVSFLLSSPLWPGCCAGKRKQLCAQCLSPSRTFTPRPTAEGGPLKGRDVGGTNRDL